MSDRRIVALLGRRDDPTDGVVDYCEWLGEALARRGYVLEMFRVRWPEVGWRAARAELRDHARAWRESWVLMQYTTLAWSRKGFPLQALRTLSAVRQSGARCGVVFHDFGPFMAGGLVGGFRRACHLHVLKGLYQQADRAIFTVPLEKVAWLPTVHGMANFVPVGANCPTPSEIHPKCDGVKTVAIYCVTGSPHMAREVSAIGYAMKRAKTVAGPLRLVVFGRGSQEADAALRQEFAGTDIEVRTLGLLSPEEVTATLAGSDVLLFVRGGISSRRGSAIAGIACGLPIVAYQGTEIAWPVTEAGLIAAPAGDCESLSVALARVLSDDTLRASLAERSRCAHARYFSWAAIADRFLAALEASGDAGTRDLVGQFDCATGGTGRVDD